MMLQHLGEFDAAASILQAISAVTRAGAVATPDQGGAASTVDVARAIAFELTLNFRT